MFVWHWGLKNEEWCCWVLKSIVEQLNIIIKGNAWSRSQNIWTLKQKQPLCNAQCACAECKIENYFI